jgi:hypothetical protein
MAEVDERIERLQTLLAMPASSDRDDDVLRHTLCLLRQLRAEMNRSAS